MDQIPDPKPADAEAQQQETVKKLVAEGIVEAMKPFQAQLETDKAEKAGLDTKITALQGENKTLQDDKTEAERQASAKTGTMQEQLDQLKLDREKDVRDATAKDRANETKLKLKSWETAAAKLGLPDPTGTVVGMNPTLSEDDGLAWLTKRKELYAEQHTKDLNVALGKDPKPGAGNVIDGHAKPAYDPMNIDTFGNVAGTTEQEQLAAVIAEEQKVMDARTASNFTPPGTGPTFTKKG